MENAEYLFKREGYSYDLSSPRIYIEIDRRNVVTDDRRQNVPFVGLSNKL